jgi:uncharacterized protein YlxW (UPF0749 family)
MLSTQFRVVQRQSALMAAGDVTLARTQALSSQVADLTKQNEALTQQVTELRAQLAKAGDGDNQAEEQLRLLQEQAGLTELVGPGVIVVMDDSKRPVTPGENPNAFIIHDEDILRVTNELFASGAEAMSINGQRLIDRSEIRCVGPVVMVNGVRTAPPVVIKAIGDPATLEAGMKLRGGVVDNLQFWGIQVSIERTDSLTIPAYTGTLTYRYAQAKGGS